MSELDRNRPGVPAKSPEPGAPSSSAAGQTTEMQAAYNVVRETKPETVVVYCSDPRFQAAFDQFIANELHLAKGSFIPIVIAGGGGVFARPHELPKEFKFMKERLELAREYFPSIRRVILINHEDCGYYGFLKSKVLGLLGARLAAAIGPREDLPTVAKVFEHLLSQLGLSVELYYAKFTDESRTKVVFEKITV